MSGFFGRLIEHQKKNKDRAANFDFFKACMAGAALITMADGKADQRESASLKALFKVLEEFKMFSRRQGEEVYTRFVDDMTKDLDKGQKKALEAIASVKDDPEWAALLVAVCTTVSEADGSVADSETVVIEQLCDHLGLDAATIKAFEVDFFDELHE